MTRTHIIAADGTKFIPIGARRKIINRVIGAAFLIITALFLSAAIIGLQRAAIAPAPALPKPLPAALKACEGIDARFQGYCISLALRPAYTIDRGANGITHTPNGFALVKECRDQYKGAELANCLTQEIS